MKDDFSQMMTPFDLSISSRSLQITKILIPFLPPQKQRLLAIYIKFLEFQNTISFFNGVRKSNIELIDMLKKFIPDEIWDNYETMMNMMSMVDMFDPASMMADMFNFDEKEGESNDGLAQ